MEQLVVTLRFLETALFFEHSPVYMGVPILKLFTFFLQGFTDLSPSLCSGKGDNNRVILDMIIQNAFKTYCLLANLFTY